jgi:hypothetical protein
MRLLCFLICFAAISDLHARVGVVRTLDGRRLAGEVLLTNGLLVIVTSTNAVSENVAVTNLLSATFDSEDGTGNGTAKGQGNGLLGYYYGNTNLTGDVAVRLDETIDFDWGSNEPILGVSADNFSVLWTGEIEAPASGDFTFFIAADDAARLYLGGPLVGEIRPGGGGAEIAGPVYSMQAGQRYPIQFQFLERSGTARVRLRWSGPGMAKSVVPKDRLYGRSFQEQHGSTITTNRGLLGTYYSASDFRGRTQTRVDPTLDFEWTSSDPAPGIARTNFSVRWSGLVKADYAEEYTFYVLADEQIRLWIDDKLVIDRPDQSWLSENRGSLPLAAGEKYPVRLEAVSRNGAAVAKLMWSSGSIAKTNIPASHLLPSRPSARQGTPDSRDKTPPGILLRHGAFLSGTVDRATETSLRISGLLRNTPVSMVNIARIVCQPLSTAMAARLAPGRSGVLLAKGDFVDGDFRGIENGQIKLNSILFGTRTFDAKTEVLAVALREPGKSAVSYQIELRDQSRLLSQTIAFERDTLVTQDQVLGTLRVPSDELAELKRVAPGSPVW